ncbi:MAG TPA: tRNA uridine-5-carboxymethylaminomethyl(34) synthesis GTPase MnmE [Methylibium sp.]|uniref:tRNA uridine-5-carboxymethylaminomethyl(34) synthesis GTPase MnmE n=1 Tax=Methylibium sp. TaxID=2067992 RepID=UPI002DBA38B4|nr:tRNA uridine-5-carboxymethylaminomethyl(34) synthesis GTPase MnmE [Methylibium sp.]HEU4459514.1 tRNA uridine-5-carboxymethylaminomethyl(34) synthesis GTPase MnmE [Methylibium sp.]
MTAGHGVDSIGAAGRGADPIVAVATAAGRGAVGIVRVSGRGLGALARAICARDLQPRHAHYGAFLDAHGAPIDHGLALFFPAPHSYTGEDVLELQAHGGPVLLQLLLARCLEAAQERIDGAERLPRLRLARPGEFTERAFLNGKLDLAQAEAVADLIDASTEAAARSAGRALAGAFSHEVTRLHDELVGLRVLVEATLDFPEEEIDFLERADAAGRLARVDAALDATLARAKQGALLREGLKIVLAGQPNVGKSSLLNALAGAELAIVTPIPGTTRDRIAQSLQIDGVPLHVIDTAGLRADTQAGDDVEREGIARSWAAIAESDAVLFVHDLSRVGEPGYDAAERAIAASLPAGAAVIDVFNKLDLGRGAGPAAEALRISAKDGRGLDALRRRLLEQAGWQPGAEDVFVARGRHLEALRRSAAHIASARAMLAGGQVPLELLAEDLRAAHDALGAITGRVAPDDLLGLIFGRFCIGK